MVALGDESWTNTPGVLGGMFAVWNDFCGNGISEQDIHLRSFPAVQVLSEKLWRGKNQDVPYEKFEALCRIMPEAPGVNLLARIPGKTELTVPDKVYTFNGTDTLMTSLAEVGYPYTVSFSICPDKDSNISGVLFKGPHSVIYTNWENTNRIAFGRDGYTFVFNSYRLPTEKWTDIRIEGDYKGTSLYVNGQLQSQDISYGKGATVDICGTPDCEFQIGRSYEDELRQLNGNIAEIRIWNTCRTKEEIWTNMYKVEDPENEESLLAYWKFNEGEGNIVKDHSKHGFDAVSAEPLVWPTGIEIPQINK